MPSRQFCEFCGAPLAPSAREKKYCSDQHRRAAQNERRKDERLDAKCARDAIDHAMPDPDWSSIIRGDDAMASLFMFDALPAVWYVEKIKQGLTKSKPRKPKRKSWEDDWLRLV